MDAHVNLADTERWISALGGAALAAYGLRQLKDEKSPAGAMLAAAGGALIVRGATGHCPVYGAAGVRTGGATQTRRRLAGDRGLRVEDAVTIYRTADDLYGFWRDFAHLPSFMPHLVSVTELDRSRSHWVARAPAGRTVEWDAEIINERPGELIAWRTLDGSEVVSAGSVHFTPAPGDRGTEVRVVLQYDPPGGKLGAKIAWMFGKEPSQTIREDLRRLKRLMEAGEVPTTAHQPRGGQREGGRVARHQ
jgi:uncharacterized membrane protein